MALFWPFSTVWDAIKHGEYFYSERFGSALKFWVVKHSLFNIYETFAANVITLGFVYVSR